MTGYRTLAVALALAVEACAGAPEEAPQEQAQTPKPAACETSGAMVDLLAAQAAVNGAMAYPLGGGVPVEQVVEGLKAQAAAATTRAEHLRVLEAFVYALGDHHAHLSTNDNLSPRLVPTGASVWVEWRDGKLVVVERNGVPGSTGGLRSGMVIEKIDGVSAAEALKPPPSTPDKADAMMGFAGRVSLAGTREHIPNVTARTTDGRELTVPVMPRAAGGSSKLASLSFPLKDVAVIRLHNSIGNSDLNPVFDDLMEQARGMATIILDLRDTPSGGDSAVAKPLMAWFVEGARGYQKHERGGKSWIEQVEGRKDHFRGRLIVLVDHWTGSMGEGAAIGLRAAAGAKLVGTRMAGLRGAIESFDLPCLGVSVRLPVERLYEVNGAPRENAVPDVLISEEDLAAGGYPDVFLLRALAVAHWAALAASVSIAGFLAP